MFAESVATIAMTHERVARAYVKDGTISLAIPPLRALLEIMADGSTSRGLAAGVAGVPRAVHPRVGARLATGTRERLAAKQAAAGARAAAGLAAIEKFVTTPGNEEPTARLGMPARVAAARAEVERLSGAGVRRAARRHLGQHPALAAGSARHVRVDRVVEVGQQRVELARSPRR